MAHVRRTTHTNPHYPHFIYENKFNYVLAMACEYIHPSRQWPETERVSEWASEWVSDGETAVMLCKWPEVKTSWNVDGIAMKVLKLHYSDILCRLNSIQCALIRMCAVLCACDKIHFHNVSMIFDHHIYDNGCKHWNTYKTAISSIVPE